MAVNCMFLHSTKYFRPLNQAPLDRQLNAKKIDTVAAVIAQISLDK